MGSLEFHDKLVSLDLSSTYTCTSFPKNPVPLVVGTTLLCGSRSSHFHQSAEAALLVQYGEERGHVGEASSHHHRSTHSLNMSSHGNAGVLKGRRKVLLGRRCLDLHQHAPLFLVKITVVRAYWWLGG